MSKLSVLGFEHTSGGTITVSNNFEAELNTSDFPSGTIVKTSVIQDSTRSTLTSGTTGTVFSGNFTKVRGDSTLIVRHTTFGNGAASGVCGLCLRLDGTTEDFGSSYQYDNAYSPQVRQLIGSGRFEGVSAGSHTMAVGWNSAASGGEHPFVLKNPNANDDSRLYQKVSTIVIYEVID
jgi:hypothetical protein